MLHFLKVTTTTTNKINENRKPTVNPMVAAGAAAAAGTVDCVVFFCYGVKDTKNIYIM